MAELPPTGLIDTYQLYIDGRWVEPENGRYDDISPSTEQVIAPRRTRASGRSVPRSMPRAGHSTTGRGPP